VLQGVQEIMMYYRTCETKSSIKDDSWSISLGAEQRHFLNRLSLAENPQQLFLAFVDDKLACARTQCNTFSQMYAQESMHSSLRMRKDVLNNMFRSLGQMKEQFVRSKRAIVDLVESIGHRRRGCSEQQAVESVRQMREALDGLKQFVALVSVRLGLQDTADALQGATELVQHFMEFRHTLMNNVMAVVGSVDSWAQEPFMRRPQAREMLLLLC
jgi:hypothetical protein